MKQRGNMLIVYAVIALAFIAALGGIYGYGHHAGSQAKQVEWDEASRAQHAKEEKQSAIAAGDLERTRVKERIVFRDVEKAVDRIVDRPVYRNVCLDADGLRLANCAIRGQGADQCKPDDPMPGIRPPRSGDRSGGLALDYELGRGLPRLLGEAQVPG